MDAVRETAIAELGGRESLGRIEDHLWALATFPHLDTVALGMCLLRIDESGPPLRDLLGRAAAGELLSGDDARLLFRGLHILGGAREPQGFQLLLTLLRRPGRELGRLLGDCVTETLARIVAGMFDGDVDALFAAICDPDRDEFARDALMGAATFLTWDGRIDRPRYEAFLKAFFDEEPAPAGDHAWVGWQEAISLLAVNALIPDVEAAFARGLVPHFVMSLRHFRDDLAETERAPNDIERFRKAHLGYLDDVREELERWPVSDGGYDPAEVFGSRAMEGVGEPVRNPFRHVGRNDPCPCGSGKKAKKCCLAA